MYDFLIKGGLVVDGTGEKKPEKLDVAVSGGKIAKIAPSIDAGDAKIYRADGLTVSPGFFDNHSHGDLAFLLGTSARNYLEQGITCEIDGQCGQSLVPYYPGAFENNSMFTGGIVPADEMKEVCRNFKSYFEYMDTMDLPTNMAHLIGHGEVRAKVMGFSPEEPTPEQLDEMKSIVAEAMENGCVGMSTGLIYPPSVYGKMDELVELCRVVAKYGGIYATHIRGEGDTLIEAVTEALTIGERAGCAVHISHLKVTGRHNKGLSEKVLELIDEAGERGIQVTSDQYPFTAGFTGLTAAFPPQYMHDGMIAFIDKVAASDEFRKKVIETVKAGYEGENFFRDSGFDGSLIVVCGATPQYVGKTIQEIADDEGKDPYDTALDIMIANRGVVGMAFFHQNDEDMMRILSHPRIAAGCDWSHIIQDYTPESIGGAHPRGVSTLPRHLQLVRDNDLMPVEKAIHRITGMPAAIAGLENVGLLKEGYDANICVFDWETIGAANDYIHPFIPNTGIRYVFVNGELAAEDGHITGVKAGKCLRHTRPTYYP